MTKMCLLRTHQVRCFRPNLARTFTAIDPIHTKLRFRIWHDLFERYKKIDLRFKIVMAIGSIATGTAFYFSHRDELVMSRADSVLSAFVQGRGFDVDADEDAIVVRKDLNAQLLAILTPKKIDLYAVVVGERGSGKSTAVRKVIASLPEPRGIIYFNAPASSWKFSIELAKTIGFKDEIDMVGGVRRHLSGLSKEEKEPDMKHEPRATFDRLDSALLEAASTFKRRYKRPLVLVIDSVDILAKKEPEFLGILQDFAKERACIGDLRIVFISSDGSALTMLQSHSAWSRAQDPLEVGEISDEDAVKYLVSKDVPESKAKRAVEELTGGLFADLNKYVQVHNMKTMDVLIADRDNAIDVVLERMELPVNHPLFVKIHQEKVIRTGNALRLGLKQEKIDLLLAANILAAHPNGTYTFHDRHATNFFAKMLKG